MWGFICALKKSLRVSISTKCLSLDKRNKFWESLLQRLLVWASHLNWSSSVIPSTLCSETCSTGVESTDSDKVYVEF